MERKTKIHVENGQQVITIAREFDLPVQLLFKAYTEADIIEQWMGTKVLKLESKNHGGWQYETKDHQGNVVFGANGVIHELITNKRIIRTFEMANLSLGVQLEIYDFEQLTDNTSKLNVRVIYESVEKRDQHMKMPFAYGINMAHNQLQEVVSKLK